MWTPGATLTLKYMLMSWVLRRAELSSRREALLDRDSAPEALDCSADEAADPPPAPVTAAPPPGAETAL